MAITPEFLDCLNQTINVARVTGLLGDGSAECVYGVPVAQVARVEPQSKMVNSPNGKEKMSTTLIITEFAITEEDRVWLPGVDSADNTLARLPMLVEVGVDTDGTPHHFEVSI